MPAPTPEPEPQPQTPGENTVTPNDNPGDKPGDKPGNNPNDKPGDNPGGKTVELEGKTDYVGVDFDQYDDEATVTTNDQDRAVAVKDEGENNILENGAGDVEENGQAFAEQAGNEYKATIGDKSEDNERTVEVGDVDTDSRTTTEAAQTFENDDHTVNEKADEDSNGFENFTYENLFN